MQSKIRHSILAPAILAAAACGQSGGIIWGQSRPAPDVTVIPIDSTHVDVRISGWSTVRSLGTFSGESVAAGIGVSPGVRTVDKSEFESEEDGDAMSLAPLFDFGYDPGVTADFNRIVNQPGLLWNGFLARVLRPIPGYRHGTLTFRFSDPSAIHLDSFLRQLNGAVVAVAQVGLGGQVLNNSRLHRFTLSAARIRLAPLMYYKFERGTGASAMNYQRDYSGAPRSGTMTGNAWGHGRFGGGLRGGDATTHASCDTRWHGGLHGNLTIAWWMHRSKPAVPDTSHVFSGLGLHMFTGGPAQKLIRLSGANIGPLTGPDVQTKAASRWVHVALVVSQPSSSRDTTIQWFLDGVPQPAKILLGTTLSVPEQSATLLLGGRRGAPNFYNLDEFRVLARAATAVEIKQMATGPTAAEGAYGTSSGCLLSTFGGPPTSGNRGFEIRVIGDPSSTVGLAAGAPRTIPISIAGGKLYLDLGASTMFFGKTNAAGQFRFNASLPNVKDVHVHIQAYLAPPQRAPAISRAVAIAIE